MHSACSTNRCVLVAWGINVRAMSEHLSMSVCEKGRVETSEDDVGGHVKSEDGAYRE